MSSPRVQRWSGAAAVAGGVLWSIAGGALARRPARVPGVTFRPSTDLLPWLGVGLVLIAAAVVGWQTVQPVRDGRAGRWAARALLAGATLYALGHGLRLVLDGAWEPAVPLGLLTAVVALGAFAIASWRARTLPSWAGALMLGSAVTLLLFNDQYVTAWASLPFGGVWIAIGSWLLRAAPLGEPHAAAAVRRAPERR